MADADEAINCKKILNHIEPNFCTAYVNQLFMCALVIILSIHVLKTFYFEQVNNVGSIIMIKASVSQSFKVVDHKMFTNFYIEVQILDNILLV